MSISENLHNLGALMKTNLEEKGIDGLTGNEGLTTLANKILDIECNSSSNNLVANFTGNSISLGGNSSTWLTSTGYVMIDWGDGTIDTVNNPSTALSHTYNDDLNEHLIIFYGIVTSLGDGCFYNCSGLTNITIPDSVTSLGVECFYNCSGLTSVTIPDSVTSIGNYCFSGCSGLTSIVIPNSVTRFANSCFRGCSGLTSIVIPDSVTSFSDFCFRGCSSLTNIIIPNSVINFGMGCFRECSGLTSFVIPDSVISLGAECFQGCSSLTSIVIPNSVTKLSTNCFQGCSSLPSIVISNSIVSIQSGCFDGCSSLINYELYWTAPPARYNSTDMPVNTDTVFTIPHGATRRYTMMSYPSDRLVER